MDIDTRDTALQLRGAERALEDVKADRDRLLGALTASRLEAEEYRMALAEVRTVLDRVLSLQVARLTG